MSQLTTIKHSNALLTLAKGSHPAFNATSVRLGGLADTPSAFFSKQNVASYTCVIVRMVK
jgi:hypothetical protein